MARLVILKNPLALRDHEIVELAPGESIIDALQRTYPTGFGAPCRYYLNGEERDLDYLDDVPTDEDAPIIMVMPGWESVLIAVITAVIGTAINLLISALFPPPKAPTFATAPSPSPVYSIGPPGNQARLGEALPVIYGQVLTVPDYASAPYVEYANNEQYAHALLCVGKGKHDISQILLDDVDIRDAQEGTVDVQVFQPADHNGQFGTIANAVLYDFNENVFTSSQVDNTEIADPDAPLQNGGDQLADYVIEMRAGSNEILFHPLPGLFVPEVVDGQVFTISGQGNFTIQSHSTDPVTGVLTIIPVETVAQSFNPFGVWQTYTPAGGLYTWGPVGSSQTVVGRVGEFPIGGVYQVELLGASPPPENSRDWIFTISGVDNNYSSGIARYYGQAYLNDEPKQFSYAEEWRWRTVSFALKANIAAGSAGKDRLGWFPVQRHNMLIDKVQLDFNMPGGLFRQQDNGSLGFARIELKVEVERLTYDDLPTGIVHVENIDFTMGTNTPQRRTIELSLANGKLPDVTSGPGRFRVKLTRTALGTPSDNRDNKRIIWDGLKGFSAGVRLEETTGIPAPYGTLYDGCTLVAIRMRATNATSASARERVRVRCTRILPVYGAPGNEERPTRNPVDALRDMYVAPYGAGRSDDELDRPELEDAWTSFEGVAGFDGIFTSSVSLFEALTYSLQCVMARPLTIGSRLSLVRDGVKPVRTQLFAPANMVPDSLRITYQFDSEDVSDGYEVEYRDPETWTPAYTRFPKNSIRPERVVLFGCTNPVHIERYAEVMWQRRLHQRTQATFVTEMEGHLPVIGDRIGIAHDMPNWGQSGIVLGVNGLVLTLDKNVNWAIPNPRLLLRDPEGLASVPIPVTRGNSDSEVILGVAPGFDPTFEIIGAGMSAAPTIWSFGPVDRVVRDFLVTAIEPQGGVEVQVTAVNYDERLYGPAPFMRRII